VHVMKIPRVILANCPMCTSILAVPIEVAGIRELTITVDQDFLRDHAQRCAVVMDVMPDRRATRISSQPLGPRSKPKS
jgi:hypothetical protein